LKNSGGDGDASLAQLRDEFIVACFACVGRRCAHETRAPLAARVTVERKLRNRENRASGVGERAVHLALIIIKDAQVDDFFGHRGRNGWSVVAADGDERYEAHADFAYHGAIDFHSRFGDALDHSSHRSPKIVMRGRTAGERELC
jgi:hypothetical protein